MTTRLEFCLLLVEAEFVFALIQIVVFKIFVPNYGYLSNLEKLRSFQKVLFFQPMKNQDTFQVVFPWY